MGFAGELSTIGLPEVFQNVAFNRLTGILTVREQGREAAVFVEDGVVRAVRGERPFDYVELAIGCDAAPAKAVRAAAKRQRRRRALRDVLRADDRFDEARYDAAIHAAVQEEMVLLFGWKYASFVFEEVRPEEGTFDRDQLTAAISLDPTAIAMEAARRVDEWETISNQIHSERDIFLPVGDIATNEDDPVLHEVLGLLDGTHDLAGIIERLPYGRFHVLRTVATLSERGVVARASSEQLIELSGVAEEEGDVERSVRYLEAALEMDRANFDAGRELVRLYERGGRRNDAARQLKRLARAQEQEGDVDGSLQSYERAAELAPYETDALERITNIHDERGDVGAFMRAGLRLAETLSSNGLLEEALEAYHRLLAQDEESVVLREALATVYIKLHEPKKAARELLVLARATWDRGDAPRALHYYRNVLAVDRACVEAERRIEEIEEQRRTERRRRRLHRIKVAVWSIVLSATAWQGVREWMAHSALHEAARASLSAIAIEGAEDSMVHAIGHYARIAEAYPWTQGAREAEQTARMLLLNELERIRTLVQDDPAAAGKALRRLARAQVPKGLRALRQDGHDRLLEAVNAAKAK